MIKECPSLAEIAQDPPKGLKYHFRINGKSLSDYINRIPNENGIEKSSLQESKTAQTDLPLTSYLKNVFSSFLAEEDYDKSFSEKFDKFLSNKIEKPNAMSTPK